MRGAQEWKKLPPPWLAGRAARPFGINLFGFRLAPSRVRPSCDPPAVLTAYLVTTATAVVILLAGSGTVKLALWQRVGASYLLYALWPNGRL